jgi:hypothetical protein
MVQKFHIYKRHFTDLQKDQQMLKEVVDVLLIVPNFSTPTCFGIWLPSLGVRECLTSYSSNVLCYGRVRTMTRPVWPVVVPLPLLCNYLIHIFFFPYIICLFLTSFPVSSIRRSIYCYIYISSRNSSINLFIHHQHINPSIKLCILSLVHPPLNPFIHLCTDIYTYIPGLQCLRNEEHSSLFSVTIYQFWPPKLMIDLHS